MSEHERAAAGRQNSGLSFFDAEDVDRPIPSQPWARLALAAFAIVVAATACWEVYWRGKGLYPGDYKQSVSLWAKEREKATDAPWVIIGSSRIFFGFDLDVYEQATGVRPVQLAMEGTSPRIVLADLAEDPAFRGNLIIGVTVPLFFSQYGGRRADFVERWRKVSLADRIDLQLSRPLEETFAFIDDQSRLKVQFSYWPFPVREGMKPKFNPRKLESLTFDRNAHLWERVLADPRYREEAKEMWRIGMRNNAPPPGPDGKPKVMPDAAIDAVIAEIKGHVDAIRARGGDVIFVRLPFTGSYEMEYFAFPRERFFDRLAAETQSAGVTFEDYPEWGPFEIPEDSHLSHASAKRFTAALATVLEKEMAAAAASREQVQ